MAEKKPTVKANDVKKMTPEQVKQMLDEKAAGRRAWLKKNGMLIGGAAIILIALTFLTFGGAAVGSLAALYIFGNDGRISGRQDGNVYMRNGRIRGFRVPALIRNAYTMTQRGIFATLSAAFRGLSQGDILSWNEFSYNTSSRFGQVVAVKGKQAYVGLNANLLDIGFSPNSSAPVPTSVPTLDSATLAADASAGTVDLSWTTGATAANVEHLVFATAPLSPGVSRPSKSAFRLIGIIANTSSSPATLGTAYTNKFGAITAKTGDKIFIQV